MRIKIRQSAAVVNIDGVRLDRFVPGREYEVGTALGTLMLVEKWAEMVIEEPAQPERRDIAADSAPRKPRRSR